MGRFTYLDHNANAFAQASTVISASSEDAIYTALNLQRLPVSNAFRTGAVSGVTIQIALDAAADIRFLGLINHNLTENALVTVNGGSTSEPDGSEFATVIPWRERDMFRLLNVPETYQYWSLIITDSPPEGFIEIGYLMGGNAVTLDFGFHYGWHVADNYDNIGSENYGVPNVQEGSTQTRIEMTWAELIKAESDVLRAFFKTIKGNLIPFCLMPDADEAEGYFGRFTGPLDIARDMRHSTNTTFIEDSRGLRMRA